MANKKRSPQFAIAIHPQILTPADALAMVIVTTAATYAIEHFDEFESWIKEYAAKHEKTPEKITKEILLLSIGRMIRILPEEL